MLHGITRFAIAGPRRILITALLLMIAAGVYGAPVMEKLSAGGFRNPASESWYASRMLADKFGVNWMVLVSQQ